MDDHEVEQEAAALRQALREICAAGEVAHAVLKAAAQLETDLGRRADAAETLLADALVRARTALMGSGVQPLIEQDGLLLRQLSQGRVLACDGKCHKAFGVAARPRVQVGPPSDPDDFAYLADDEVGEAPADNGRPLRPEERLGRWCYRECERCVLAAAGEPITLPDFTHRSYNRPASDPQQKGGN